MEANPRIATCSGKAYLEDKNGRLVFERHADDVSIGASKFYRVSCFKAIGGFVCKLTRGTGNPLSSLSNERLDRLQLG